MILPCHDSVGPSLGEGGPYLTRIRTRCALEIEDEDEDKDEEEEEEEFEWSGGRPYSTPTEGEDPPSLQKLRRGERLLVGEDDSGESEDAYNQGHQRHNVTPTKTRISFFVAGGENCSNKTTFPLGNPKCCFLHKYLSSISRANRYHQPV